MCELIQCFWIFTEGWLFLLNFEASSLNKIQLKKKKMLPSFYSKSHVLKNKKNIAKYKINIFWKLNLQKNKLKQYLNEKAMKLIELQVNNILPQAFFQVEAQFVWLLSESQFASFLHLWSQYSSLAAIFLSRMCIVCLEFSPYWVLLPILLPSVSKCWKMIESYIFIYVIFFNAVI